MIGITSQLAASGLALQLAQSPKQSITVQNETILSQYGYSRVADSPIFAKPKSYTNYLVGPKGGVIGIGSNEAEELQPEQKRIILAAVSSGKLVKLKDTEGTYSFSVRNIFGHQELAYVVVDRKSQIRGYFKSGIPEDSYTNANLMPKAGEGSSLPSDQPLLQNELGVFRYIGSHREFVQTTSKFKEVIPPFDSKHLGELIKLKKEVQTALDTNWRAIEKGLKDTGRLPEKVSLPDEIYRNRRELQQLGVTSEDISYALWSLVRVREVAKSPNVGIRFNGDVYAVDFERMRATRSSPFSDKINDADLQVEFTRLSDGKKLVMNSELIRHIENASFFRSIQPPPIYDKESASKPLSYSPKEVAEFLHLGRTLESSIDRMQKNSVGKLLSNPSEGVLIGTVEELTTLENAGSAFGLHPLKGKNFRFIPDSVPAAILASNLVLNKGLGATEQTPSQLELKHVRPSAINSKQVDSIGSYSRPDLMISLLNRVTSASLSNVQASQRHFNLNSILGKLSGKPEERDLAEKFLSLFGKAKDNGGVNIRIFAEVIKSGSYDFEKFDQDSWARLDRAAPYLRSELNRELSICKISPKQKPGEFFRQSLAVIELDKAQQYFKNVSPRPVTRQEIVQLEQIYKKVGANPSVALSTAEIEFLKSFQIDKREIPEAVRRHSDERYNPMIQTLNGSVREELRLEGALSSLRSSLSGVVYARAKDILDELRFSPVLITPIGRSNFASENVDDVEAFSSLLKKEKPQSIASLNNLLGQYLNPELTVLIKNGAITVHGRPAGDLEKCYYRFNEQQFKKMPGVKTEGGKSSVKVGGLDIAYSLGELTVGKRTFSVDLRTKDMGPAHESTPGLDSDPGPIQ